VLRCNQCQVAATAYTHGRRSAYRCLALRRLSDAPRICSRLQKIEGSRSNPQNHPRDPFHNLSSTSIHIMSAKVASGGGGNAAFRVCIALGSYENIG
jgi:hypothetical protein